MFNYTAFATQKLDELRSDGRYRVFLELIRDPKTFPLVKARTASGWQDITLWCSNDYLGMSLHSDVLASATDAIAAHGVGAGGTRNISGTSFEIAALERDLSIWLETESALMCSSGYVANQTALTVLGKIFPQVRFFSDALNHNSLVEGLRGSRADKVIFRHNDAAHLEQLLSEAPRGIPKIVVCESLYSMEGSPAPLAEFSRIARAHNALLVVDETHALGVYGATGAGLIQQQNLTHQVPLMTSGLGKGVGVVGGVIAGDQVLVDLIRSFGAGFIFTTALPPAISAAISASLRVLRRSVAERAHVMRLAEHIRSELKKLGFDARGEGTHLVPVIIPGAFACKKVSSELLEKFGVYAQAITSPTVPVGEERLRLTPTARHTLSDAQYLISSLKAVAAGKEDISNESVRCCAAVSGNAASL